MRIEAVKTLNFLIANLTVRELNITQVTGCILSKIMILAVCAYSAGIKYSSVNVAKLILGKCLILHLAVVDGVVLIK